MNPLEELRNGVARDVNNALAQDLSPVVVIGLLEIIKGDVFAQMQAVAKAQAENKIIPVNRINPNGH